MLNQIFSTAIMVAIKSRPQAVLEVLLNLQPLDQKSIFTDAPITETVMGLGMCLEILKV